ncbi:hypothetical protein ENHY17A_600031 [Moraxellaceae bacterium 17A]|nr:hypothetical protein ENHY17A_600031 [Moraxellaceae bacterium 17A]
MGVEEDEPPPPHATKFVAANKAKQILFKLVILYILLLNFSKKTGLMC